MFITIWFIVMVWVMVSLVRLEIVHSLRMGIIDKIYNLAINNRSYDFHLAYGRLQKISYEASVFKLWKPVKSFYDIDYILYGKKKDV